MDIGIQYVGNMAVLSLFFVDVIIFWVLVPVSHTLADNMLALEHWHHWHYKFTDACVSVSQGKNS